MGHVYSKVIGKVGEVSWICQELDRELAEFRERPLDDARYPYIWFDAPYEKVRMGPGSSARRW